MGRFVDKLASAKETVLVLSDLQAPFQHPDALDFIKACQDAYQPTRTVCIGDEMDYHALSDYEHDPDGYSAGHEHEAGMKFMRQLYKVIGEDCDVAISNHTSRPLRKAFSAGIPEVFLRKYEDFMEAPSGWKWRRYFEIDGVRYEHGDELGIGGSGETAARRAPLLVGQPVVFGHFHAGAGIEWMGNPNDLIFGFNVGCMIDWHAYTFRYWKSKKRPILGLGIVDRGIPIFVPMFLKRGGRWIGKL